MLKNMTECEHKTEIFYELVFDDGHHNGFGFPCDANGNTSIEYQEAKDNLNWCKQHPEKFKRFNEVVRYEREYVEPVSGDCSCGERIILTDQYYGACQCPQCGKWYNLFGQELLPPDQWERDPSEEEYW